MSKERKATIKDFYASECRTLYYIYDEAKLWVVVLPELDELYYEVEFPNGKVRCYSFDLALRYANGEESLINS